MIKRLVMKFRNKLWSKLKFQNKTKEYRGLKWLEKVRKGFKRLEIARKHSGNEILEMSCKEY